MHTITKFHALIVGASAAAALFAPITIANAQTASTTATGPDCGIHPQGYSGFSNVWKDGHYGNLNGQIYVCRNGQLVKF